MQDGFKTERPILTTSLTYKLQQRISMHRSQAKISASGSNTAWLKPTEPGLLKRAEEAAHGRITDFSSKVYSESK